MDYVDIVDKLIYNIIVKILQAPSRVKHTHHKGGNMKVKLLENDKIIEVPNWNWYLIDNEKVVIDQLGEIIAIVVEE